MPPAISDDEIDDVDDVDIPDSIPARKSSKGKKIEESEDEENDDRDEDGEEDEEDEYQVEKILGHSHDAKGKVLYQIKWLGYEDEKDLTWEPISNLEGAKAILDAYHGEIGGVPSPMLKGGRKKSATKTKPPKRSNGEAFEDTPVPATKRGRKSETNGSEPGLPIGSWEDDVERVSCILEDTELVTTKKQKTGKPLKGLLEWNNGRKTEHTMDVLRQKCPQRLLDYYEQHLKFLD